MPYQFNPITGQLDLVGSSTTTDIAAVTHAATSKNPPVDADELPLVDSAASNVLKKLTWATLKATVKAYTDTLYTAVGASAPPNGSAGGDLTGNYPNPTLAAAGPGATGPLGSSTVAPIVTIDAKGRVTALSSATIAAPNMARSARSSNTILAAADKGQVICATAAYTQTLTAAATLGAGWWVIVKNDTSDGTTVLVLDPNSAETIDALATVTMYSGETRLIECDGSNFFSQLLEGGYVKFTPTGGSFIVPAGLTEVDVVCIGPGGQGGGGFSGAGSANQSGGGGGGGGAVTRAIIRGSDLTAGAIVTVTVAAGGGGAGTPGNPGGSGSATTFGTLLTAGGGGGGRAGASAAANSGGGGGSPVNSSSGSVGGSPASAAATFGGASGSGNNNTAGICTEWGGASGGGGSNGLGGTAGGSSIYAGPGGASGGGASSTTGSSGSAGETTQSYTAGGGAGGGTGAGTGAKGTDGTTFIGPFCGGGGGGGGGRNASGNAGNGGAGGIGAGGGGGGAAANGTAGTGGGGGAGECRVFYS